MHTQTSDYVLGHSDAELVRLIEQAKLYEQVSEQLFRQAGISPGMRVIDLGCGPGDVSFLAARLVGPSGSVVGVDASAEAIALARHRARQSGLDNVEFVVRDIHRLQASDLRLDGHAAAAGFDALIGRFVLMYLSDPATVLRRLCELLCPSGVVTFHEIDMTVVRSEPRCELYERVGQLIVAAFAHRHIEPAFGLKLAPIFRGAGLPSPAMQIAAHASSGPDSPAYGNATEIVRTLLPVMIAARLATAEEIAVDTLTERLRAEALLRDATLTSPAVVAAWSRLPGL